MSKPPNVIDLSSPTANMFGIEPCPRCGSVFRWPPVVKSGEQGRQWLSICSGPRRDDCPRCRVGAYRFVKPRKATR